MHFIDSHCHIDFEQFDTDRNPVLEHCQQLGVKQIIVPAVTRARWQKMLGLCQHPMLYPCLGLHPLFLHEHQADDIVELRQLIPKVQPVAIGEIGLDFYHSDSDSDRQQQIALFAQQLEIAKEFDLPVIIHARKAHDQIFKLLKRHRIEKGVIHAYSGSLQQAENYIKQGFMLGAGGTLSYQKAKRIRSVFSQLPLQSLVLETDAPDMPLQNYQGQRNSPETIPSIARFLAEIREDTVDNIARQTTENTQTLFNLIRN